MKHFVLYPFFLLLLLPAFALQAGTVNRVDSLGQRQGYWKIYGAMSPISGYQSGELVEEGHFVNDLREGLWIKYFPGGVKESEITYKSNLPQGPYKLYYKSGQLEEAGVWKNSRNTQWLKRYHPNGNLAQNFTFNDRGKRNGPQYYYYPNGQLRMKVQIKNGVEQGSLKRYYANGDLKEQMQFNDGTLLASTVKYYKLTLPLEASTENQFTKQAPSPASDHPNLDKFKSNGYNTLYNKNKEITQVGRFRQGKLWDGKYYRYSSEGILMRIEVYNQGLYIGDSPLPKESK